MDKQRFTSAMIAFGSLAFLLILAMSLSATKSVLGIDITPTVFVYLPYVSKQPTATPGPPGQGISGRITYQANPIGGITLELRFYDGHSYSTIRTTTTQADGIYQFTDAPSLGTSQRYFVRYRNTSNPSYVSGCSGRLLNSYAAGTNVLGGNFDIADIPQVSPPHGATVTLPYTFTWTRRAATPSDNYALEIWNEQDFWITDPPAGYVSEYTFSDLPSNLHFDVQYRWDLLHYLSGDINCSSFDQDRTVTFSR